MSIMSDNAIIYTIDKLFKIADHEGKVEYWIEIDRQKSYVIINMLGNKKIIVRLADDSEWFSLLDSNEHKLKYVVNFNNKRKIPILFWGSKDNQFVQYDGINTVIFNGDIISSSFFMLSRWEELQIESSDKHGRFPLNRCVAFKYNFLDIPIVDEYAMILRNQIRIINPTLNLGEGKFKLLLSHDIDRVRKFDSLNSVLKNFAKILIREKNVTRIVRELTSLLDSLKNKENDPYYRNINRLIEISSKYNVHSAFYFMTSEKSKYDRGYMFDKTLIKIIQRIKNQRFEVGFHPSYYTFDDFSRFIKEKEILDDIIKDTKYGGRQHYLRFSISKSANVWEEAGLLYDSSLGYAEAEGFRCGTSHPYKLFDFNSDEEMRLIEIPLLVMDVTLKNYENYSKEQALKKVIDIMEKCYEVEGTFTLLWHNTSVTDGWETWIEEVYIPVIIAAKDKMRKKDQGSEYY